MGPVFFTDAPERTLLVDVAARGEIARGDAARITGLPERSARRVLDEAAKAGLLASATPKGVVFLRFTPASADVLFAGG